MSNRKIDLKIAVKSKNFVGPKTTDFDFFKWQNSIMSTGDCLFMSDPPIQNDKVG